MRRWVISILFFLPLFCEAQIISTFAGNGIEANTGDGFPATAASIDYPTGGVFDKNGNFYFTLGTRGHGVRKVSTDGIISRVAGTGIAGFGGEGGPATNAQLKTAQTVAIDTAGNILIADSENRRIRKVDAITGIITTVAGTGLTGFNGDGAALSTNIVPNNLCFDKYGNLYFSEVSRIRKLDKLGNIATVAGNGTAGFGGNNVLATSVPINAIGICFDQANNLYFADDYGRIYKVDGSGTMFYYAGNGAGGYSGDGGPAIFARMRPTYIKMDKLGNMFVGESVMSRVRLINNSGIITTIVGTGVPGYNGDGILATSAQIKFPGGIALDTCGNLYISDSHDWRIRKVTFNPECWPVNVKEVSNSAPISMYPNPTSNELTITATEKITSVSISNALGQVIMAAQYKGKEKATIDVGHLPVGMYIVRVNNVYMQRFLKE